MTAAADLALAPRMQPFEQAPTRRSRLSFLADFSLRELGSLARLAGPIAAVAFLNMGMSLTDVFMVGWLGSDALAAVAVMSDAYSIVFYLAAGVLAATAPLIAEARGAGRDAAVRHIIRHGLWATVLVAGPAAALVWAMPDILAGIGLGRRVIDLGAPYGRIMAGTIAMMMPVVLWRQILSAHERPRVFMWFTAAALPLNALGNYLFIFGGWGVPAMGTAGAATSSLAVAGFMAIGLTAYVAFAPAFRHRRLFHRLWMIRPARLAEIFRLGLPIGVSSLAEVGVYLTATIVIAVFPTEAVAAHTIALRLAGIAYSPCNALGVAVTVRTAHAAGARDAGRLRRNGTTAVAGGVLLGGAIFCGLWAAAEQLPWLFLAARDPGAAAIASLAATLLVLLGFCEASQGPASAAIGILRGRKDTRVPMLLTIASQWGVGFITGVALAFGLGWGAVGIWTGLALGTACTAATSCARLRFLAVRNAW